MKTVYKEKELKNPDIFQKYKSLIKIAPLGVVIINKLGIITSCNPAIVKMTGLSEEEIVGKNITKLSFLQKEDLQEYLKIFYDLLKKKRYFETEFIYRTKNGAKRSGMAYANSVSSKGEISEIIVFIKDITDLKDSEKTTAQITTLYTNQKSIIDNIPVLQYAISPEGIIRDCNKQVLKSLEYSRKKELIGKSMLKTIYPPSSRGKARKLFLRWKKQGSIKNEEIQIRTKSGKLLDVMLNVSSLYNNDGTTYSSISTQIDITELRKAEKTINEERGKAENYLNIAGVIILVVDASQKVSLINLKGCEVLGYKKEEIIGKNWFDNFLPKNIRSEVKIIFNKLMSGDKKTLEFHENPVLTKDGKIRMITWHNKLIMDKDDKILGILSSGEDITDRKETENNLKDSYIKLKKTFDDTINTLASIVEIRDPYTSGHQKRVAQLATCISKEIGLPKDRIEATNTAALLHDIGKINIPTSILARPGKLSEIEYTMIKTHPQLGCDVLKKIEFPWPIADIILQHHEKENGTGYPIGLKGKNILLEAKILLVADVVEAMSSHRPYRPALGMKKAMEEITEKRGKLYNTEVVNACYKMINEKGFRFKDKSYTKKNEENEYYLY